MKKLAAAIAFAGGVTMMAGQAAAATPAECDIHARNYANAYAQPGGDVVGGLVAGGILGAIVGVL